MKGIASRVTLKPELGPEGLLLQVEQVLNDRREYDKAWMTIARTFTPEQRATVLHYVSLVRRQEHALGARDVLRLIRDERLTLPRPAPLVVRRSTVPVNGTAAPKATPPTVPDVQSVSDAPFTVECAARSIEDLVQRRGSITFEEVTGHLGLESEVQQHAIRHLRLNNRVVVQGRTLHRRSP